MTKLHIDLKLLFDTIRELSKRAIGKTLYLIDEPTTGFSFYDVHKVNRNRLQLLGYNKV